MEKIQDLLSIEHPQHNTVTATTSVRDALYKMYCEHIDHLIVLDGEKFIGLLTEHDVAGKVLFSEKPLHHTPVKEFMNTHVPVATTDDLVEDALFLMENYAAGYIAVFEDFEFKAILSAQDLMRQALKNRQTA